LGASCRALLALAAGDRVGEVYFQFGEPDGEDGVKFWWRASKTSDKKIVAQIEEGTLKALNCP
jgi:hypothetical protein